MHDEPADETALRVALDELYGEGPGLLSQTKLANGIRTKLRSLKAERDGARSASGRDLVVVKHTVVDDEMAKLGLSFTEKSKKGRRVHVESYRQGQAAAQSLLNVL